MAQKELYSKSKVVSKVCEVDISHILDDRGQPPLWPFSIVEGMRILSKCFHKELYLTLKKLKERGLKPEEIAKLFRHSSRIADTLHLVQFPPSDLTPEQRIELIEDLVKYLSYYRKEDIFCEKGKNIVWTKKEIKDILGKIKLIELKDDEESNKIREIVGKINTVLWLYTELIQVAHHAYSHEFHGPYFLENGKFLIVREYYDLKPPTFIWPFTLKLPFDKIITFEVYKNVEIKFDCYNHSESSSALPQHLLAFLLCVENYENCVTNLSSLKNVLSICKDVMNEANEFIKNFTKKDWFKKLVEMHHYSLKLHKEILGESYKPNSQIYNFLETLEIKDLEKEVGMFMGEIGKVIKLPREKVLEILKKIFLNNIYKK
jgi:hypothetical protein